MNQNTNHSLCQNIPSTSNEEGPPMVLVKNRPVIINEDQRAKEARRRSQRQRKNRNKQLKKMKTIITKLKTKLNTERQKYKRIARKLKKVKKSVENTPKMRIEEMSEDVSKKKELVQTALFGEVMKTQLEENYAKIKSHKEKMKFKQSISGGIVENYKLWKFKNKVLTYKKTRNNLSKSKTKNRKMQLQSLVEQFLEDDANSRIAAGKKEFISRGQIKMQKRYLLDSMKNLHKKFLKIVPFVISYTLFNRLRPFWIVPPTLLNRDTCKNTCKNSFNSK